MINHIYYFLCIYQANLNLFYKHSILLKLNMINIILIKTKKIIISSNSYKISILFILLDYLRIKANFIIIIINTKAIIKDIYYMFNIIEVIR